MVRATKKPGVLNDIEDILASRRLGREGDRHWEQWEAIGRVQQAGGRTALKRCLAMCRSGDPLERELAADILGQLGWSGGEHPFRSESVPALTRLLSDQCEMVIDAAIAALGRIDAQDLLLARIALTRHSSALIRLSMAQALNLRDSPKARRALIRLSSDEDEDVRNWATFGLGTQCDNNTKAIRTALFARVDDSHEETRNEALLGLARRKVRDVIPYLVRELETDPDNPSPLALEAARELLAPEFLAPLTAIVQEHGDPDETIQKTISKIIECEGESTVEE